VPTLTCPSSCVPFLVCDARRRFFLRFMTCVAPGETRLRAQKSPIPPEPSKRVTLSSVPPISRLGLPILRQVASSAAAEQVIHRLAPNVSYLYSPRFESPCAKTHALMERRAPPDARCQAPRPRRYPAAIRRGNDRVSVRFHTHPETTTSADGPTRPDPTHQMAPPRGDAYLSTRCRISRRMSAA
jgi:hypothetical protein